jgi:hypothetical protein
MVIIFLFSGPGFFKYSPYPDLRKMMDVSLPIDFEQVFLKIITHAD